MLYLYDIGLNDNDIKGILELVPSIKDMDFDEIVNKIDILRYIGCNLRQIKNIVVSNPYYFELMDRDILRMVKYLKNIGISEVNLFFDSNPFILNKDVSEIKDYVDRKINDGFSMDDILDEIECNPYIID